MEKIPMTRAGHTALETELKHLKSVERPAIIKAIAEAREHGDLSENAEYHSAKEKQSFIEGRIKELEGVISLADVIDPAKMSGAIKFGATVTLVDEDTDEEKTYQIVGEYEANIEKGLLNIKSPIARALIGNPRILILDEATASVDTQTEFEIQEALERLVSGRTTFAIAHRLSTLKNADRLLVLERGRIVEVGTHADLLANEDGVYRNLVNMQTEMAKVRAL